MNTDLTERLSSLAELLDDYPFETKLTGAADLCRDAVTAIEALHAALAPFAAEYMTFDCVQVEGVEMLPDDHTFGLIGEWPPMHSPMESEFTFGDLRRAHELVGADLKAVRDEPESIL